MSIDPRLDVDALAALAAEDPEALAELIGLAAVAQRPPRVIVLTSFDEGELTGYSWDRYGEPSRRQDGESESELLARARSECPVTEGNQVILSEQRSNGPKAVPGAAECFLTTALSH